MPTPIPSIRRLGALVLACLASLTLATHAQQRTTASYPPATEVGEAVITTDPETRQLIVVTDDETAEQIGKVITNLDRPAPQVLIKVVFVEVTHRKGQDIGVDARYNTTTDNGNNINLGQAFGGLSGLTSGTGIFSIVGDDFTVILRAIAEAGKLEVLSRPTILARNNQQASIVVGQRVPLITGTTFDNFGNQRNVITYEDVGIVLTVTPFITSDDLVEMIVNPVISNLSDQTVQVSSTGTNSIGYPIINTRSADTVVVTRDNQTVVIGGLMQNTKTESESKVPFLGDIPGLGALFRRRVTGEAKTELLIFLTPQIIKNPMLLSATTVREQAHQKLVPQAFGQSELDRFLNSVPPPDPEPAKSSSKSRRKSR